ncbi:MAG: cupin domain-containing protein [Flavobacteriaceae bacterium]|nr:cupin domain-containing protein [Flavobacteriaceae bacterium]
MKTIAMIPARLGSKRVPMKNLRLINGKPLVCYIAEAAIAAQCFDEIYINSESDIFKEIADHYNIKFYKRPEHLASDNATNDEFMYDFMLHHDTDHVVQLLATSPFVTPEQIKEFTQTLHRPAPNGEKIGTLISVKNAQIECMWKGIPINFDKNEQTKPSQDLLPIHVYACALMGWDTEMYMKCMSLFNSAYHGCGGHTETFELTGYATVDIDNEEDFLLAEQVAAVLGKKPNEPRYYKPEMLNWHSETDVPSILAKDGVVDNDLFDANNEIVSLEILIAQKPKDKSWSHRLVDTDSNSMTAICQMQGEGNRLHKHDSWNEWWYIYQGSWLFTIDGEDKVVKQGDVVFIAAGKIHRIKSMQDGSIRLAVSRGDVPHIYIK